MHDTRWALREYWRLCLRRCALGEYCTCLEVCTRWALELDILCRRILGEYLTSNLYRGVYCWVLDLDILCRWILGEFWTFRLKLFMKIYISEEHWIHTFWRNVTKWVTERLKFNDHMDLDKVIAKMNECWPFVYIDWKWMKINHIISAIFRKWYESGFFYSHCLGNHRDPFY